MGKLRKLRTRFISSIGAVKRSVLRRQSRSNSTASNPTTTTLTRLASLDSAVPTRTRTTARGAQKRKIQQSQEQNQEQLHLHWNEARRIYSEPVQSVQRLSTGREENRSSTETEPSDARSQCCAVSEELAGKNGSSVECISDEHVAQQVSDEEDYDDVFLQSWEEAGTYFYF